MMHGVGFQFAVHEINNNFRASIEKIEHVDLNAGELYLSHKAETSTASSPTSERLL